MGRASRRRRGRRSQASGPTGRVAPRDDGPRLPARFLLHLLAIIAFIIGLNVIGADAGTWATIIGGLWILFSAAENAASPNTRAELSAWLRGIDPAALPARWPRIFAAIFDNLFGRRHLSVRCFLASALASAACVVVLIMLWRRFRIADYVLYSMTHLDLRGDVGTQRVIDIIPAPALLELLLYTVGNIAFDYLSLLETRFLIGHMANARSRSAVVSLLFLDLLLTVSIAAAGLLAFRYVLPFLYQLNILVIYGAEALSRTTVVSRITIPWTIGSAVLFLPIDEGQVTFGIFFYASFFTSLWLWLYVTSAVCVRLAAYLGIQLKRMTFLFDIDKRPIESLGVVVVVVITILGRQAGLWRGPCGSGYSGYFADLGGSLWEVAHNPGFPHV